MLPNPKSSLDLATKKAWTLVDEFKAFAFKGNVVDLAIGVIIGGSFHSIVDSMVKNVMMPLFAVLIPGQRPTRTGNSRPEGARSTSAFSWLTSSISSSWRPSCSCSS